MKETMGIFETAWLFIWNIIKNSRTYKIVRGLYDKISGAWKNSAIAKWFRCLHINEDALNKTVAGKIVRSPFSLIEAIGRKYGSIFSDKIEKSTILNLCRCVMNNILAINLRFIGIIVVLAALAFMVKGFSLALAVVFIVGVGLSFINSNVCDWFKGSAIAKFICLAFDIDADFNWYDEKYLQGKTRYILAAVLGLVSGVVGLINPLFALLLPVGITVVFLIMQNVAVGAFLLIFVAPIVPTMVGAALSILCVFSLLVQAVTYKDFKFKFDGIGFFILIFIAVYLVAAITSFAMIKSLSIWAIYLVFMLAYFVIINSINSKKLLNNILTFFVISGTLVCLYGIAQYLFGWDTAQAWIDDEMFEDIKMRIYSTLGNPNVLGEYILLVLPVAIGLMWTRKKFFSRIVYAGISAVMLLALILTFSRGCWIGLMIAAMVFITFAAGKLWGLGLVALPIIPMVLPESIVNRFMSIGDMEDSSTSYRVYIWMGTIAMIKDFWVSGIGMGQEAFNQVYPFYSFNGIVAPHSHNLFLQILVESGIAGILVFAIILILFMRRMMTGYQFGGKGNTISTIITAISAGICGFLVQGMFDNCFYNYRVMLVFWCVLAMGRACVYVAKQESELVK